MQSDSSHRRPPRKLRPGPAKGAHRPPLGVVPAPAARPPGLALTGGCPALVTTPRELEQQLLPYEQLLRNAGQFITVQRRAMLRFLLRQRSHPTTGQITQAVSEAQTASLATIYNNLSLFAQLGIVRAMRVDDGETHWDIRTDPHHHLRCTACGQVSDIEPSAAEVVLHDAQLAGRTSQSQIWLLGTCQNCQPRR